ncbi:MAG: ATP synthase F1 subunit delta [Candidatus Eremiobacteraeota bacterium]|nr:ATP synthase F1 subunit delta [Candidatus Eremiobacteraeota bacterium]
MVNEKLARRYATAVFSLARERKAVDRVGDDLAAIASAIQSDTQVREFFVAPVIERPVKERMLLQTFEGKVDEISLHTLLLLVRKRRESILAALAGEYQKLQLAARGAETLRVTTARAIPPEELRAMVHRLERLYEKKFEVTQVVEPSLIGGARILMGDRRVDGSVSGRLDALARTLFARN